MAGKTGATEENLQRHRENVHLTQYGPEQGCQLRTPLLCGNGANNIATVAQSGGARRKQRHKRETDES